MGGEFRQLLTDDDRQAYLRRLLGHRFKAHEQILLPTLDQYNSLVTNDGLQVVGYEMCRQLGFKPNGLKIRYSDTSLRTGSLIDHSSKTILINPQFKQHPYSSGAELALAVTAYAAEHLSHETPDRSFLEFATVETGLGLWIINALRPRMSLRQAIYHMIDSSWFHSDGIQLETYNPRQYVERFVSFTHEHRIASDTYLPHVLGRVRYLLPTFVQQQSSLHLPEASVTLAHQKSANLLWAKVLMIALIITSGVVFGIYALSNRPAPVNPEQERLQKSISELKQSYEKCLQEAAEQQNTYDPNDLFLTRQIDETKSRCESLRNQYNYTIDEYRQLR